MLPRYSDEDFALTGLIQANYTSGKYVRGNASVTIEMRERGPEMWTRPPAGTVKRTITQVWHYFVTYLIIVKCFSNECNNCPLRWMATLAS